jgi:hypothetical protein
MKGTAETRSGPDPLSSHPQHEYFKTISILFIILSFKNNANVASKGKRQKIRKQFLDAVLKVTDEK